MLLRLAHGTSWDKQWSEAMDLIQTIFKINIFLLRILEIYMAKKPPEFDVTYVPIVMNQK